MEFSFQSFMRDTVKRFGKIKNCNVHWVTSVDGLRSVMCRQDELSDTRVMFTETMLLWSKNVVFFQMTTDMGVNYVLKKFTTNSSHGDWPIVERESFVAFLIQSRNIG